jgi:hypothetical protein
VVGHELLRRLDAEAERQHRAEPGDLHLAEPRQRADAQAGALARAAREAHSGRCAPLVDERGARPHPRLVDRVQPGLHGREIPGGGGRLDVQPEGRQLICAERSTVSLQRVSCAARSFRVARGRSLSQRRELARHVCEELVDELGEERLVVPDARTEVSEDSRVEHHRHAEEGRG